MKNYSSILTKEILVHEYVYKHKTLKCMATQFGCGKETIRKYLKKYNINRRPKGTRYFTNYDYFNNWSHEMAYILGLCISDGNIHNQRLSFGNKTSDKIILEFIRNQISPNRPIFLYSQIDKRTNETYCSARLNIHGLPNTTLKTLQNLGVFPNKTGKEFLPECPHEYKSHLLRGIFDGDGWASQSTKYTMEYGICSSSTIFLTQVQNSLCFHYGKIQINNTTNCSSLRVRKKEHITHLVNFMYQNDFCSLIRKKRLFIQGGHLYGK